MAVKKRKTKPENLLSEVASLVAKPHLERIKVLEKQVDDLTRGATALSSDLAKARSVTRADLRELCAQHSAAESRLLEWLRKNAPEQLDPTGSTHLYDTCLRIMAEWHRHRVEAGMRGAGQ